MLKELETISKKLDEAHSIVYRTVEPLDEVGATAMVTDQWTVKDELAHLAGAERGMLRIAQASARGEEPKLPEGYNNDENNARMVARRKTQTFAQLFDELKRVHADLAQFLDGVTEEQLTRMGEHPLEGEIALKDLLVVIYSHEMGHCNDIINVVKKRK